METNIIFVLFGLAGNFFNNILSSTAYEKYVKPKLGVNNNDEYNKGTDYINWVGNWLSIGGNTDKVINNKEFYNQVKTFIDFLKNNKEGDSATNTFEYIQDYYNIYFTYREACIIKNSLESLDISLKLTEKFLEVFSSKNLQQAYSSYYLRLRREKQKNLSLIYRINKSPEVKDKLYTSFLEHGLVLAELASSLEHNNTNADLVDAILLSRATVISDYKYIDKDIVFAAQEAELLLNDIKMVLSNGINLHYHTASLLYKRITQALLKAAQTDKKHVTSLLSINMETRQFVVDKYALLDANQSRLIYKTLLQVNNFILSNLSLQHNVREKIAQETAWLKFKYDIDEKNFSRKETEPVTISDDIAKNILADIEKQYLNKDLSYKSEAYEVILKEITVLLNNNYDLFNSLREVIFAQ